LPPELIPNLDDLPSGDGKPVDNPYVEREYRLLTDAPYSSWSGPGEGRPFLVYANVGWYIGPGEPAIVPDCLLSLDVAPIPPRQREGRSYFQWIYGKPPDVVIEIVSDRRGDEEGLKLRKYARQGVSYYVIHDPADLLGHGVLRVWELRGRRYNPIEPGWMPDVGLGLMLWEGEFQGIHETWLRWCDREGRPLPTGAERAERERQRADDERQRAEDKLERLRAQLRALGKEPEA
jgi:Uma2 family endonuclease